MKSVRELHDKAIELAQLTLIARQNGELEKAEKLAILAYQNESQAADLVPEGQSSEPTRSILYRSAASLAYQCQKFQIAQRLIAKGLSGYPSPEVEQELKDLYEQVNFESHLRMRGILLEENDLQLSIQGDSVGFGMIIYNEFLKRVQALRSIFDRTTQRLLKREYQRSGRVAGIYQIFTPTLSVPRGGSFAITFKLATSPEKQMSLFVNASQVIDEVLTGLELVNSGDMDGLSERIPEQAYYLNFISLTKDIAPDGEQVKYIGLTSRNREVGLSRARDEIQFVHEVQPERDEYESDREAIEVEGNLDYATSRKRNVIGLTTEENDPYFVVIKEGMDDLVKSYFNQPVRVNGVTFDGKYIYPVDIQSLE